MKRRGYFSMLILFAATALWAAGEPTAEELENQRRVEALRKHPEQIARLRENVEAFQTLPQKRKDAIVQLDHDLHDLPANKQDRYWKALERYADWLDQLHKDDPPAWGAITGAPDAATRLAFIRDQRDREWMQGQAKAHRLDWEKLQGEARAKFVANLRLDERQKHAQWQLAQKFWEELERKKELPCRLSDFTVAKDGSPGKVKTYVEEYLLPFLSAEEKDRLAHAEGRWPDYPRTLVEIASKHPSALPPPRLPKSLAELPVPIQNRVIDKKGTGKKKALLTQLHKFEGREEFASKVVEVATKKGVGQPFEFEYWASNHRALLAPMKKFVEEQLKPVLDTAEKKTLLDSENGWPFYPQTIQELAQKHKLNPPWHILPEADKWKWDAYRLPKARATAPAVVRDKQGDPPRGKE
jgi:hypothetical protein